MKWNLNANFRMIVLALTMTATLLTAEKAQAILELNVGYQGVMSSSSGGNWTVPNLSYSGAYGLQADIRANIPMMDWNFGLRYGQLGLTGTQAGQTLEMNNSSVSALVGYRLINTLLLLGPVFTYSLSNTGTLKNTLSTSGSTAETPSSINQYTAGLEFGIKFPVLIEVEAGIASLTMSGFSNNQKIGGNATNVDLNGTYARASVGFSF